MIRLMSCCILGAFLSGGGAIAAAPTEPPLPTALASLQAGQWAFRPIDGSGSVKTLCLGDPRALIQLRHGNLPCSRFVITNGAAEAVVNYSCGAPGNGRTTVRVETPRVVQIESQGIAGKAPFELVYEGRRTGECPIPGPTAQR